MNLLLRHGTVTNPPFLVIRVLSPRADLGALPVATLLLVLLLCLGAVVVANPVPAPAVAGADGAAAADAPPSAAAAVSSSPLDEAPHTSGGGHIFVCDDWHLGKRCRASPLNFRCTRDGHMQYDEPDNRCRDKTRCSCEMPRRLELRQQR